MDQLGFRIPSLSDILHFYFFNAVPVFVIIICVLFVVFERYRVTPKKVAIWIIALPVLFILVYLGYGLIRYPSGNLEELWIVPITIGWILFIISIPTILSYFYYSLLKRTKRMSLLVIGLTVGLFVFFYPKPIEYAVDDTSLNYVFETVQMTNRYNINNERYIMMRTCGCMGIGTESFCYGIRAACYESQVDTCISSPPGEPCSPLRIDLYYLYNLMHSFL